MYVYTSIILLTATSRRNAIMGNPITNRLEKEFARQVFVIQFEASIVCDGDSRGGG